VRKFWPVLLALCIVTLLTGCYASDPFPPIFVEEIDYVPGYWDDLRTPVNAVRIPGSKAPGWYNAIGTQVLGFDDEALAANEEEVYLTVQMPHGYQEGTSIVPHVHFVYALNEVGTNVRWGMSYQWLNVDEAAGVTATIYALSDATNNDAMTHRIAYFPAIVGTGKTISSILTIRLFRNSSNALDTYTGLADFLEFDIHYLMNTPGSLAEGHK